MKNQLLKSVLTLSAFMVTMSVSAQRPIIQTKFTADPAPMVHNDTVFLYTTHDEDYAPEGYAGFRMKEWLLYTSTDMVNWTDHGKVANLHNFTWAAKEIPVGVALIMEHGLHNVLSEMESFIYIVLFKVVA